MKGNDYQEKSASVILPKLLKIIIIENFCFWQKAQQGQFLKLSAETLIIL
jgi:hypothetical protein